MKKIIKEAIVVEGRDDTAAINRAVDAMTIETHGFGMSKKMWDLVEKAYNEQGIIVFTDPDFSGEQIRRKLLAKFPNCKQAFLSKEAATKKGDIGIENASPIDICEALEKAKCTKDSCDEFFTMEDLEEFHLWGGKGSKERREQLGAKLGIGYGNGKTFLKKLNYFGISKEEFYKTIKDMQ